MKDEDFYDYCNTFVLSFESEDPLVNKITKEVALVLVTQYYDKCKAYIKEEDAKKTVEVKTPKVYYAHHQWKYNTPIEAYELDVIKNNFQGYDIFNPSIDLTFDKNNPPHDDIIMLECFNAIRECQYLVFTSLSGVIGKGVFKEIKYARSQKIPVYYLTNNEIIQYLKSPIMECDENKTNKIYATV